MLAPVTREQLLILLLEQPVDPPDHTALHFIKADGQQRVGGGEPSLGLHIIEMAASFTSPWITKTKKAQLVPQLLQPLPSSQTQDLELSTKKDMNNYNQQGQWLPGFHQNIFL